MENTNADELSEVYENVESDPPVAAAEDSPELMKTGAGAKTTLTLEEASARLGPEILQVLEDKFNGSLTEVRSLDEKDQLLP